MNQNKDFYVFKFLLPTSLLMMTVGFFLMSPSAGDTTKYISSFLFIFGIIFFVLSLVERSAYHKRNADIVIEQKNTNLDKSSMLARIGFGIIIVAISYFALVFLALKYSF